MVRYWKFLKIYNGKALMVACLLAFIATIHFTIRIIELRKSRPNNCTYEERIDIVYTWVNGSDPLFIEEMNKYLNLKKGNIDSSKQRYEDKNELRFSLRSIEKYAPWINHIYLVTNGQIPYWLNLDCDKITVVTHEAIFKDMNNLPTFSSPAIESNLHRIPGLSKRFIYFNDDIFIGQPLYLDDFYAPNKGYLIFLAYPLPNCAKSCPWLYVGDGQCDLSCNTKNCQFDGGDCSEKQNGQVVYGVEVNSEETTDSYNEKVNQELKGLQQGVQTSLGHNHSQRVSEIKLNTNYTKDTLNKVINKDEERKSRIYMPRNVNVSISKLVEEHNMKIIVENKKLSRKRRSVFKKGLYREFLKGSHRPSRRNIDGFLESLMYTQKLFNKKYGFKPRFVPAHAPIFLEKDIMQRLEDTFQTEFELTERNRFRQDDDVQFGFSYYYFLLSETTKKPVGTVFDDFDTDNSGTWSDREIRNLLTKIYKLPLSYEMVDHFEGILLNCSELTKSSEMYTPPYERYLDSRLPTISKDMVTECPFLSDYLRKKFGQVLKYKYQVIMDAEDSLSTFRMLVSNITSVVISLDKIRSDMKKFVCLNDNLDESKPKDNELVRALLYDFYLSLFPHPSEFELPEHSRNRFLHMAELREWRRRHFVVKIVLCLAIVSLIIITFFNVFRKGCCKMLSGLFC